HEVPKRYLWEIKLLHFTENSHGCKRFTIVDIKRIGVFPQASVGFAFAQSPPQRRLFPDIEYLFSKLIRQMKNLMLGSRKVIFAEESRRYGQPQCSLSD